MRRESPGSERGERVMLHLFTNHTPQVGGATPEIYTTGEVWIPDFLRCVRQKSPVRQHKLYHFALFANNILTFLIFLWFLCLENIFASRKLGLTQWQDLVASSLQRRIAREWPAEQWADLHQRWRNGNMTISAARAQKPLRLEMVLVSLAALHFTPACQLLGRCKVL